MKGRCILNLLSLNKSGVCKGLAGDLGEAADNSYPFDIMSSL